MEVLRVRKIEEGYCLECLSPVRVAPEEIIKCYKCGEITKENVVGLEKKPTWQLDIWDLYNCKVRLKDGTVGYLDDAGNDYHTYIGLCEESSGVYTRFRFEIDEVDEVLEVYEKAKKNIVPGKLVFEDN